MEFEVVNNAKENQKGQALTNQIQAIFSFTSSHISIV